MTGAPDADPASRGRWTVAGAAYGRDVIPNQKDLTMDKWRIAKNSTIVRLSASAGTLVAVVALVGAGHKWV